MGDKSLAQIPARRNGPVSYTLGLRTTNHAHQRNSTVVAVENVIISTKLSAPLAFLGDPLRKQLFKYELRISLTFVG